MQRIKLEQKSKKISRADFEIKAEGEHIGNARCRGGLFLSKTSMDISFGDMRWHMRACAGLWGMRYLKEYNVNAFRPFEITNENGRKIGIAYQCLLERLKGKETYYTRIHIENHMYEVYILALGEQGTKYMIYDGEHQISLAEKDSTVYNSLHSFEIYAPDDISVMISILTCCYIYAANAYDAGDPGGISIHRYIHYTNSNAVWSKYDHSWGAPSKESCIAEKLQSEKGASIIFALFFFMICAVIGSVVLTAGTAAAGRLSKAKEIDNCYYAVNSAAQVLSDEIGKTKIVGLSSNASDSVTIYDEEYNTTQTGGIQTAICEMLNTLESDGAAPRKSYTVTSSISDVDVDVTLTLTSSDSESLPARSVIATVVGTSTAGTDATYTITLKFPVHSDYRTDYKEVRDGPPGRPGTTITRTELHTDTLAWTVASATKGGVDP